MKELSPNMSSFSAHELLMWYKHVGVDFALRDEPVDQFASFEEEKQSRTNKATREAGITEKQDASKRDSNLKLARNSLPSESGRISGAAMPDENTINKARETADAADSIEDLRKSLTDFRGCNLHLSAKNMVFADGNRESDIMLIGDAPGRDEDIHGMPFVGISGRLLDSMLAAIGLGRDTTYLTYVIPWRPPGNRTPTDQEIEICRPFIERHIELIKPRLIILLGDAATKILLKSNQSIVKLHGRWAIYELNDKQIDVMPIFHPANLLLQPAQKKMAWQDLLKIKQKLLES